MHEVRVPILIGDDSAISQICLPLIARRVGKELDPQRRIRRAVDRPGHHHAPAGVRVSHRQHRKVLEGVRPAVGVHVGDGVVGGHARDTEVNAQSGVGVNAVLRDRVTRPRGGTQFHPVAAAVGDRVPRTGYRTSDRVVVPAGRDEHASIRVAEVGGPGRIRPDEVALNPIAVRARVRQEHPMRAAATDDVTGPGSCAAHGVAGRALLDLHSGQSVAHHTAAIGLDPDPVPQHQISRCPDIQHVDAVEVVAGDHVASGNRRSADRVVGSSRIQLDPRESISHIEKTSGIGANAIPLDRVARGAAATEQDPGHGVPGNQVAVRRGQSADDVVGTENIEAHPRIAEIGPPRHVGADVVPGDGVPIRTRLNLDPVAQEPVDHQPANRAAIAAIGQPQAISRGPGRRAVQLDDRCAAEIGVCRAVEDHRLNQRGKRSPDIDRVRSADQWIADVEVDAIGPGRVVRGGERFSQTDLPIGSLVGNQVDDARHVAASGGITRRVDDQASGERRVQGKLGRVVRREVRGCRAELGTDRDDRCECFGERRVAARIGRDVREAEIGLALTVKDGVTGGR